MDRGAWRATVHGVTKSQTRLKRLSTHAANLGSLGRVDHTLLKGAAGKPV